VLVFADGSWFDATSGSLPAPLTTGCANDAGNTHRRAFGLVALTGSGVVMMPTDQSVPWAVRVPDEVLADLRRRLDRTRWLPASPGPSWSYGTDQGYLRRVVAFWRDAFDPRAWERSLNSVGNFVTTVDGQPIHFVHRRSPVPDALPLLLTHGWPSCFAEFLPVLDLLADPEAHGGSPADAFHVVCPSLPGFGWSSPLRASGWDAARTARAWEELMRRLGYESYGAHGGDWGSAVSALLAEAAPDRLVGIHLNVLMTPFPTEQARLQAEREGTPFVIQHKDEFGFSVLQRTAPQTPAYSLNDSPAGLASWILEKFRAWSDCSGDLDTAFTLDTLVGIIMTYWITGTAGSAARMYFETRQSRRRCPERFIETPTAVAVFPKETYQTPRWFAERYYNVTQWNQMPGGGHFPALEQPTILVEDIRAHFRDRRSA
jgi:pimeloyl-ACP methyl ester carboxylesterase